MAGLVGKSSVDSQPSAPLHCNKRAMNGTATIRAPTPQMATGAWMAGLVRLFSRPATAPAGRHALTIVARAECPVSLLVRKLKVVDGVSQPVTRETVGAKDRIIEGHRQGRVVDPRRAPGIQWRVRYLEQGDEG